MDLVLNNLQRLICHKTQQTKPSLILVKQLFLCLAFKPGIGDPFVS